MNLFGIYNDAAGICRPIPEESEDTSVSDERPQEQDTSWFIVGDHAKQRYIPQKAVWRFNLFDLFAGCSASGKIDRCESLQKGKCSDVSAAVPVRVELAPSFSYDLAAKTRAALASLSTANPCLLEGLMGVSFIKLEGEERGDYVVGKGLVAIDPTKTPPTVTNAKQHWEVTSYTLYHEIGHHIFRFVLPSQCHDLQVDFASISWDDSGAMRPGMNPDVDNGDFLSSDAIKSPNEDFATSVGYYLAFPDRLRTRAKRSPALARKYDFIKNLLRENEY